WNALRAIGPYIIRYASNRPNALPIIVVEGATPRPAGPQRSESTKTGVRLGLVQLGERIDPGGCVLWWAPGRGVGIFIPSSRVGTMAEWIADRQLVLDSVQRTHEQNVALTADAFALF